MCISFVRAVNCLVYQFLSFNCLAFLHIWLQMFLSPNEAFFLSVHFSFTAVYRVFAKFDISKPNKSVRQYSNIVPRYTPKFSKFLIPLTRACNPYPS